MTRTSPAPQPVRPPPPAWLVAILALLLAGAAPPEVVRVRVPSDRVSAWFPPGTELRGLGTAEFEALVVAARSVPGSGPGGGTSRLIGARHEARWDEGALFGRSEFVLESDDDGPGQVELEPWSPAVERGWAAGMPLRSRPDGRIVLNVERAGQSTVSVPWELHARPDSDGRVFALALPRLDASSLALDLPADLIPEGLEGIRQGPGPGSAPGRKGWRFAGPGGAIDLRLRVSTEPGASQHGPRLWAGGPTTIEVEEATARWRADWEVDPGVGGLRWLRIGLDPGLEPIEVSGPSVIAFRSEPGEAGLRLAIRLADEITGPTPVVIRALAQVPAEGRWAVPAARPLNATWIGGRTSIHLSPTRVLGACLEQSGRRIVPRSGGGGDAPPLVFEAGEPRSVAVLTFRRPEVQASAEVRGRLQLGGQAPRLEARLTWTVRRGRLLEVAADLPPGWTPTRVRWAGSDEPASWRSEPGPGGPTRIRARPPSSPEPEGEAILTLLIDASGEGRDALDLPRVRPVSAPLADESWIAEVEPGWTLRPTLARGLAWVDPPAAPESDGPGGGRLAWRWTDDRGEARVEYARLDPVPVARVQALAIVGPDRVRYDWRVELDGPGPSPRSVAIGSTLPIEGEPAWRIEADATGLPLPARTIGPDRRSALGLPTGGSAWEVELPPGSFALPVVLRGRLERPWSGRGTLPLLTPLGDWDVRGTILILVDRASRSTVEAAGLRRLDPTVTWDALDPDLGREPDTSLATHRRAHAFGYDGPADRLDLRTEALQPGPVEGLVQEAILSTTTAAAGAHRQRLTLRVAATRARNLEVTLPPGSTLVRARRDGQPTAPIRRGDALSLVLPDPDPARPIRTFTLDYATEGGPEAAGLDRVLVPALPTLSLPCLAFSWEVVLADPWALDRAGSSWIDTEPAAAPATPEDRLVGWVRGRATVPEAEAEALRDLDARVAADSGDELTLAEWFARWDAGRWPLAIDRLALAEARLGPWSPIAPPRTRSGQSEGAAAEALRALGLVVVPVRGILLITTPDRAPDRSDRRALDEAWGPRLLDAAGLGSDVSDRFQSVARWRGEVTPETATTVALPGGSSEAVRRLTTPGWPEFDDWIGLDRPASRSTWALAIGLAALLVGIAGRDLPARSRALGAGAALAGSLLASAWAWPRGSTLAAGLLGGTLAVLAFWAGRAIPIGTGSRSPRAGRLVGPPSSRSGRLAGERTLAILAAALALTLAGLALADDPATAGRILALLPFDGVPEPDEPGDRVVLRLDDYERLRGWASRSAGPTGARVEAEAAEHRVRWGEGGELRVETAIDLHVTGAGRSAWTFPIGEAHDLSASLDDRPVPISVGPHARVGTVRVEGPGPHRLVLERRTTARPGEAGPTYRLPIGPVANARIAIDPPPEGRRVEVPSARGWVRDSADGGADVLLGPADALEVRLVSADPIEAMPGRGAVEAAILWDAEPAGDRIRARLTFRNPEGTPLVRLRLGPRISVRSATAPGLLEATWRVQGEDVLWIARVEPPLPDGGVLELDLWRAPGPASPTGEARPGPATLPDDGPRPIRPVPRIEPVGFERVTGLLVLRWPESWSGHFLTPEAAEPIGEAAFAAPWGRTPTEARPWGGAVRLPLAGEPSAWIGRVPDRRSIRQAVRVAIEAGRLDVQVDAELVDLSGRTFEVAVRLPEALRLVRVEAEGLTTWSRPAPGRAVLRFDGRAADRRAIRLRGWLPVASDPLAAGSIRRQADAPWPAWEDADEEPGILTLIAPTPAPTARTSAGSGARLPDLTAGPGVVAIATPTAAEPAGSTRATATALAPPATRWTYRVDRPEDLGAIRWAVEPSWVFVAVQGLLTVYPTSAEWAASLRYQVDRGPCEALYLRVPTAWAESAEVEVVGMGHELTARSEGETTAWTIRPDRPLWGTHHVIVRSSRPSRPGESIDFPALVPRGHGAAETSLMVANATGGRLGLEGSPGLQPVEAARLSDDVPAPPEGIPLTAYRVRKDDWTLRIRTPGNPASPRLEGYEEGQPRVALADVLCAIAADGSAWGQARFDLEADPGPFLPVLLPGGSEAVRATVDGAPAQPLRGASDRWLIPLGDGQASRVSLIWRARSPRVFPDGTHALALPGLDQERVPTLFTIDAGESAAFSLPGGQVEVSTAPLLEIERAERQASRILGRLESIDRSSSQDRFDLIGALARFELQARAADRTAWRGLADGSAIARQWYDRTAARTQAARASVLEAVRAYGLEDLALTARREVGLEALDPDPESDAPRIPLTDPPGPLQVRRLGRAHYFRTESLGRGQFPLIRWASRPPTPPWLRADLWAFSMLAAFAGMLVRAAVGHSLDGRPWILGALTTGIASAAALVGLIPIAALAACLGVFGLGLATRSA